MATPAEDLVVLLDPDLTPCGTAPRAHVHTETTPLHLAFSCYVIDDDHRVLMTRRALAKRTWPGVWTNACCGHPRPGESFEDAIERRLAEELGTCAASIGLALPDFRYEAVDASGIRENEHCPVFVATLAVGIEPNPDEVMDLRWAHPAGLIDVADRAPWLLSPWSAAQIPQLGMFSPGADAAPAS